MRSERDEETLARLVVGATPRDRSRSSIEEVLEITRALATLLDDQAGGVHAALSAAHCRD